MSLKRRRSSAGQHEAPVAKKTRSRHPKDYLSDLSDELLIRILHNLPIQTILQCQLLSHRFYTLAGDSQVWKNLYYNRFVLPRVLRIPGIKTIPKDEALQFSSRRSKWLDDETLVNRRDGKETNWKRQYKLRYNWSIGACEVQEIHVKDRPSVPSMIVKLADGVVLTADKEDGLRAWDLKEKVLIASFALEEGAVPTCLAVDEQDVGKGSLGIAVGFLDGGWETWKLDVAEKEFLNEHRHPASINGTLSAVAYAKPYILTITEMQLLSLYSFGAIPTKPKEEISNLPKDVEDKYTSPFLHSIPNEITRPIITTLLDEQTLISENTPDEILLPNSTTVATATTTSPPSSNTPHLLTSLSSHTTWPPLSLSIRTTPSTLIASIAYSLPTYFSGYTIGLQELHLSLSTLAITSSRLASALPQGFSSIHPSSPTSSGTATPTSPSQHPISTHRNRSTGSRPTTLSYSHPYILATHPDNTLTLYLCTSTAENLTLTSGTKLWGHTSSVSSAEITPRGKAVSVSLRGEELRVWELEGGVKARGTSGLRRNKGSVRVRVEKDREVEKEGKEKREVGKEGYEESIEGRKRWVGFDDEMVIVLKESGRGTQALMVYDFT